MKQFTTPKQTAKLIELGFAYPKSCSGFSLDETKDAVFYYDYSIGELIEILDEQGIEIIQITDYWRVGHEHCDKCNDELIDALYEMVLQLKEEGVI